MGSEDDAEHRTVGGDDVRLPFKRDMEEKSYSVMPESLWGEMLQAEDVQGTVGMERAVGLPAVLAVIRLISHTVAMVPLQVVSGREGEIVTLEDGTWQWRLLNRSPGMPPLTPFTFKADLAANFTGRGQAFIRKGKVPNQVRGRPRITDLEVLDSSKMVAKRAPNGGVVFTDTSSGRPVDRGTDEIIQVRSFAIGQDRLNGQSPITAARMLISAGLRRGQFEDSHLANGIFPGMALKYPATITEQQAKRWIDFLKSQHQGSLKAGKLVGVGGGAELVPMPISLVDAQFAEMTRLTLEQVCGMWQVPLSLVMMTRQAPTDDDWRHFMTFAVGPLVTSMCEALNADRDMFDPVTESHMSVRPDLDAPLKFDPLKKAQVQREQVQTGTRLVDELRGLDGYAPLPPIPTDWTQRPGQIPQITPVGGAPNPTVDPTTALTPSPEA